MQPAALPASMLLSVLLMTGALWAPAEAQSVKAVNAKIDSALSDHAGFAAAFKLLQANIGDGARMAMEYEYPVTITVDGKDVVFATQEEFVAGYDAIVTPDVVDAVKAQKYKNLLVNSKGVMFGTGQLWVNVYCLDGEACLQPSWDISAINHGLK